MPIGFIPYTPGPRSTEARWLATALDLDVDVLDAGVMLNVTNHADLPDEASARAAAASLLSAQWVVAEGVGGFLWASLLRSSGYRGGITVLPYVNPTTWFDVAAIAVYRRFASTSDRVFVGSTPSSNVYRALGVDVCVGEPFGIDCATFFPRPAAGHVLRELGVGDGPMLLFAGRAEPDKELHALLRVALKARLLVPELTIVVATHVVDEAYLAVLQKVGAVERDVHFVVDPTREQLADLYCSAAVFATASTSHFETFGRAPAEALACGTAAIAPRYDGFLEVLAQPGGRLVDVVHVDGAPQVDEPQMLRAVYENLSYPPPRPAIAAAAHARFCRSKTVGLLSYLAAPPSNSVEPARGDTAVLDSAFCEAWRAALRAMLELTPDALLHDAWNERRHEPLSEFDAAFARSVRARLAGFPVDAPDHEVRVASCR